MLIDTVPGAAPRDDDALAVVCGEVVDITAQTLATVGAGVHALAVAAGRAVATADRSDFTLKA